jgi:aspartyl-tRNA(Asn)/glutamyl-tRNA(Gln) amidotransferase subunit A
MLGAVAGHDPADSTSVNLPVPDYTGALVSDVKGMKIGLPKECFIEGLDPDVQKAMDEAIATYRQLGAQFVEISLPTLDYSVAAYYLIATAEASSNLARYDGVRFGHRSETAQSLIEMFSKSRDEGFGVEVKRRIMLGTYALSSGYYDAYYLKAQKVRTLIARDFSRAFEEVDAIVTPVSPFPAFKLGEKLDDPLEMYLSDIYTITGDLAGIPCMSVPCGRTAAGLPVGMQILASHFNEAGMFRLAAAFEGAGGAARLA